MIDFSRSIDCSLLKGISRLAKDALDLKALNSFSFTSHALTFPKSNGPDHSTETIFGFEGTRETGKQTARKEKIRKVCNPTRAPAINKYEKKKVLSKKCYRGLRSVRLILFYFRHRFTPWRDQGSPRREPHEQCWCGPYHHAIPGRRRWGRPC